MDHTVSVIVYGGGEIFREYFNAIVAAVGSDIFKTLWRLSVLLAGTTAIFSAVFRRDFLTCIRWFGLYYLVFFIIFTPKISVEIIDRTNASPPSKVDNVPLGLGIVAHLTTVIGDALTQLTDKIFTMPDDLRYSRTGMMMASKMVLASRQFQITDSVLNGNMNRFMVQCVYWPILLGHYTMEDLASAPDLWGFITSKASPARTFVYDAGAKGAKTITVCKAGVVQLGKDLQVHREQVAVRHNSRIFSSFHKLISGTKATDDKTDSVTPIDVKAQLFKYLPVAYRYLLDVSSEAADILQQNIVANAIVDGTLHFGMSTNSQSAIMTYSTAKAQEQQRLSQDTIGFLAGYWLPIMKNVFEAIMYGCFLLVVLLGVFPFGAAVLKNYVYTLCWLQAWAPLYAIINLVCSYYAKGQSMGAAQEGFVLKNISGFMQANHDMASLAGYLTMSVPFIAAGLVRGMASTMTLAAQHMGGVSQSVGSQTAGEAVAGNIRMGATEMRNNSAFNFTSNQQELRGRMSSGMSYQLPGGESINFMPDGNIAVDRGGTISDLGVNVNLAKHVQNSAMKQADYAYNTAKNESVAASENYTAGVRDLYELSKHVGNSKSSGDSWVYSDSQTANDALHKNADLTSQFAKQQGISYDHAKEILARASGGLGIETGASTPGGSGSLGIGVGAKASIGIDGSIQNVDSATEQKLYNHAENFVKSSGYSENVEIAQRAVHDRSFHSNNEQGARLLDSVSGHFEKAKTLSNSSSVHFEQVQGFRNMASYAQENSIGINVNGNQAFLNNIVNLPGTNHKGHLGVGGAISALKQPEMAKIMADNFANDWSRKNLSDWNKGAFSHVPSSDNEVKQIYQSNAEGINKKSSIQSLKDQHTDNQAQITDLAKQKGISKDGSVDTSAKELVEDKISKGKEQIQQTKDQMAATELAKEQQFKKEAATAKQDRAHGVLRDAFDSTIGRVPASGGMVVDTSMKAKPPREKIREKIDDE